MSDLMLVQCGTCGIGHLFPANDVMAQNEWAQEHIKATGHRAGGYQFALATKHWIEHYR